MGRTALILIVSLGLAVSIGAYLALKMSAPVTRELRNIRIITEPPDEYLDLFKGRDSARLEVMNARWDARQNPIVRFRYDDSIEVLEAKFAWPGNSGLTERFNIAQRRVADPGFSWFDSYDLGQVEVDFESFDRPDTGFSTIFLSVEDDGMENAAANDSVISYLLKRGYFSISRSAKGRAVVYSSKRDNAGRSGSSAGTVVLFKRRKNALFLLVASPIREQTEVPNDLLVRLTGDKP